jgi:hypothetical protein
MGRFCDVLSLCFCCFFVVFVMGWAGLCIEKETNRTKYQNK